MADNGVAVCLRIRQLATGDTGPVEAVFAGLSEQSRYQRFLAAMPRLPRAMRDGLADADGHCHVALVAESVCPEPQPVGMAHYVRTAPGVAEVGLEIVDEWQRRGVGRRLLRRLVREAVRAGITRFEGTMLTENRAIIALLRAELEVEVGVDSPGTSWFSARLPAPAGQSLVA